MSPAVFNAVKALWQSVMDDEKREGGLLSRRTIRLANEMMVIIANEAKPCP